MLSLRSTDATLHSTDAIPPQYWRYPPTVLWIASAVLNSLRSTEPTLYGVKI